MSLRYLRKNKTCGGSVTDIKPSHNRFLSDETMYIGEEDNRGIAICPLKEKVPPQHAMLKAKPPQQPTAKIFFVPAPHATKDKKKSPNIVLIIASVTAGILVTCVTLASAVKYLLKNNRYSKYFYAFHIPVPHFLSFIAFLGLLIVCCNSDVLYYTNSECLCMSAMLNIYFHLPPNENIFTILRMKRFSICFIPHKINEC